ncbi:MAG: hypothetical protein WC460_01010 [Patescibacteria group bacterium]
MVNEGKVKSDEVRIVGGPNKWDLVIKALADSQTVFFDAERKNCALGTDFGKNRLKIEIRVRVEGLIRIVIDGDSWRVLGRVLGDFRDLYEIFPHEQRYFLRGKSAPAEKSVDPVYFWATYDCQSRTGEMRIAIIDQNEDYPFDPKYFPF